MTSSNSAESNGPRFTLHRPGRATLPFALGIPVSTGLALWGLLEVGWLFALVEVIILVPLVSWFFAVKLSGWTALSHRRGRTESRDR
jgi:hypothetical protein